MICHACKKSTSVQKDQKIAIFITRARRTNLVGLLPLENSFQLCCEGEVMMTVRTDPLNWWLGACPSMSNHVLFNLALDPGFCVQRMEQDDSHTPGTTFQHIGQR